jgi:signal transduction histidine kinase
LAIKLCKFAHELNNSLTIINGHAEMLRTEFSGEELISAHVTAIQQAVRHAAELIDSCQCALADMEYMDKARTRAGHYSPLEMPKISHKH